MLKKINLYASLLILIAATAVSLFGVPQSAYAENDLQGFTDKRVLDDANASAYANLMNDCLQKAITHSQSVSSDDISSGSWFKGMSQGKDPLTVGRYTDSEDGKMSCDDEHTNVAQQYVSTFKFTSNIRAACELGYRPKGHADYSVDQCVDSLDDGQPYTITNDTFNKKILQGGSPRGEHATGGYDYNDAQKYLLYKYTLDNYCQAKPAALVDSSASEDLASKPKVTLVNQSGEPYQVYYDINDGGHSEPIIFGEGDVKCSDLPGKMEATVGAYATWLKSSNPTAADNAGSGKRDGSDSADGSDGATSCDTTNTHGIGWIVCPITNFLAAGMDWLFGVLTNFLVVQPLSTDSSSALYRAWSFMRNLANVLFVIGFLVIIYSQITSLGLSSYGVKKMLPRLIVAAIIVNVSYWLCTIAIDLSNILGFAFQQMFVSIRNSLVVPGVTQTAMDSWQIVSWESMAGFILSGGAITAGVATLGFGLLTTGIGASIMLLLPVLLGVLLSALVAILVLAARQALITILVIVSPLAAVAYILPNTEKFFERWRELFGTMLFVFPIFSVVFGGAQLAGTAIILNAPKDGPSGINIILLGMAVQVAPLAITPLLIKISGNILRRFAGVVNNPNRGLIDRSRNFSNEHATAARARRLGEGRYNADGNFIYSNNNPGVRLARRFDRDKKSRAGFQKAYEANLEADFANSRSAHAIHAASNAAHLGKERGEQEAEYLFNQAVQTNAGLRRLDAETRVNQQEAAYTKTVNSNTFERMKADPTIAGELGDIAVRAQALTYDEKNESNRLNTAQRVQNSNYSNALISSPDMQDEAGDSEIDVHGALRVKTAAQAQQSAAYQERIKNFRNSFNYENIKEMDALELALGRDAAGYTASDELQEAAIEHVIGLGHVETIIRLQEGINLTDATPASIRQTYAGALKQSSQKPKFVPSSALTDAIPQGLDPTDPTNHGQALVNKWVRSAIINHKYDTNALATTDPDDINYVRQILAPDPITGAPSSVLTDLNASADGTAALDLMRRDIKRAFSDEQIYRTLGNRLKPLQNLGTELGMPVADLQPPTP